MAEFANWFVTSPLMGLLLLAVALATASLLVWRVPTVRGTVASVEAGRTPEIDGLRGLLGIGVLAHHTVITWFLLHGRPWQIPPSRLYTHAGQTSVALFFMITAFLFWGRVLARGDGIDWPELLISRLYRLYPVYLLMLALLLVAAVLAWHGPPISIREAQWAAREWLLFTMFYTPILSGVPNTSEIVAGVTWSLGCEWLFYLALPLLGFLAGRSRQPLAALLSALAVAAVFYRVEPHHQFSLGTLQCFLGGIVAAHWVRVPALVRLARRPEMALAALAAVAAVIAFVPTAYSWQATLGLTPFFLVVASGNRLWGMLRLPGLLWLGDITYSIYLLQGFLLWTVLRHALPPALRTSAPAYVGTVLLIDVALVLLASAVFLTIERPAILLGRRHIAALRRRLVPMSRPA